MPVALPDFAVTTPNTPVTLQPVANDQGDPPLSVAGFGAPAHGQVVLNADQSLTYTPAPGFIGTDSFTYTLTDGGGGVTTGTVSVVVNDLPVANDDQARTTTGMPVEIAALANDNDAGPLRIAALSTPGHGDVEVLGEQTVRYVPQPGFVGSDSFAYTVVDPHGATASAMISVDVAATNRPPVARDDTATTTVGTPVSLAPLANDNDPDGDPLILSGLSVPAHGSLTVGSDQTVTYTPAAGFVGTDEFVYTTSDGRGEQASATVRIGVERPNTAPVAATITTTTPAGTPLRLDLLARASDADGDALQLASLTLPAHGQLTVNADRSVTYAPASGFAGEDAFIYTVSDGRGGSATGEVRITVAPPPAVPTYPNGYTTRRRIVVPARPAAGATAASFVVLVSETGSWLRSQAHGGPVANASGHDLRFELEDGTKLAHEIELYDGSVGRLLAWVRLPSWNPAAAMRLFLYLGKAGLAASEANPAAAWSGYLAVWDARTGLDRSGNGRHLTPGAVTAAELIGPAARFPGTTAATAATAAFASGHAALSLQCWARAESPTVGSERGLVQQGPRTGSDGDQGALLRYAASGFRGGASNVVVWSLRTTAGTARLESAAGVHGTSPRSLHAVWRSGELPQLYLDGVATVPSWVGAITTAATAGQTLTGTTQMAAGGLGLGAGSVAGNAGTWLGLLDEVRLRATAPTAPWVAIEHASQADPQGFYGIGADEVPNDAAGSVVAVPRLATTGAGSWVDTDVLASAHVPAGAPAPTLVAVSQPAQGLATIVAGKVRYTPNAGFVGSDSFTYTLASGSKRSTAKLTVQVSALASELPPPVRTVNVSTSSALRAALTAARPGDQIVLADGTYTGSALAITAEGTAANPIIIMAANRVRLNSDGSVRIAGARITFPITLTGKHVWLYGLNLDGTGWNTGGNKLITVSGAQHCVIRRCRIYGWKARSIVFNQSAQHHRISYCDISCADFSDEPTYPAADVPSAKRTGISVDGDASTQSKDVEIDHNHFHDFPPKGNNYSAYQTAALVVGEDPSQAVVDTRWNIHHNLFKDCNCGLYVDATILELKSSSCTLELNTFHNGVAHVSSRQGTNNVIRSNWFKNVRAIRVMDGPHRIIGNKVENCTTGINVLAGNVAYTATTQEKTNNYPQAHDVLCAGNERIGTAGAFLRLGSTISSSSTLPALRTRIEGWTSAKGPISYQRHEDTEGPFASTTETWPEPVFLEPADIGLDAT